MRKYIITFGQIHAHRVNNHTFDKDSVAVIKADNESIARHIAFDLFGSKWHNCYEEEYFDDMNYIEYYPKGKLEAN